MITYKIYPLPGICDKTLKGSVEANEGRPISIETGGVRTLGDLLSAISDRDGVDFTADVPFLALLDGKPLNLSEESDRVLEDGAELLILPAIMGG
jgi:sulfur carrier protein ThiS